MRWARVEPTYWLLAPRAIAAATAFRRFLAVHFMARGGRLTRQDVYRQTAATRGRWTSWRLVLYGLIRLAFKVRSVLRAGCAVCSCLPGGRLYVCCRALDGSRRLALPPAGSTAAHASAPLIFFHAAAPRCHGRCFGSPLWRSPAAGKDMTDWRACVSEKRPPSLAGVAPRLAGGDVTRPRSPAASASWACYLFDSDGVYVYGVSAIFWYMGAPSCSSAVPWR